MNAIAFTRRRPQRGRLEGRRGACSAKVDAGFAIEHAQIKSSWPAILRGSLRSHLQRQRRSRCAGMTDFRYRSAISRRDAPELRMNPSPRKQRAWGMPGARCTRGRACRVESTRVSHHGRTEITRHSRTRMVLTVSFVLSPVIGLSCHRRRRDAKHHRQLDACVEASGPHDFAVRNQRARQPRHLRPSHPASRS